MLTRQNMLRFSAFSVAEVCLMDMTVMQPEALLGESNGPFDYENMLATSRERDSLLVVPTKTLVREYERIR